MNAVTSGFGIISAAKALALACVLLLHAIPLPALAEPAGAGHQKLYGDAGEARPPVFLAEEKFSGAALPGDSLLAMGGRRHEPVSAAEEAAMADSSGDSAGSLFRSAFKGSFVGALVFGYPYQELGIVDLAVLALIGFLVVWRFMPAPRKNSERKGDPFTANRRQGTSGQRDNARATPDASGLPNRGSPRPDSPRSNKSGGAPGQWPVREPAEQRDRRSDGGWGVAVSGAATEPLAAPPGIAPPEGFDTDDFLEGARVLYIRMQEAWAVRDTESLAPFMTPEMMLLLRERAAADPHPAGVNILLVNAALSALERQGGQERADVEFSVLMGTDSDAPAEVVEIWSFARGRDNGGMWRLAGIEPRGGRR